MSEKYAKLDIDHLLRDCDARIVAKALGMDMIERGQYTKIRCPGHKIRLGKEDEHIGNCVLKKNGYMCYACNTFVNTHDMVMEYTGCGSYEAYEIMAEAMGGVQLYAEDPKTAADRKRTLPKFILSEEEAHALGLYPRYMFAIKHNGQTVYEGLFELYKENPQAYYGLLKARCTEMLTKYQYTLAHFADVKADRAAEVYDLLGPRFDTAVYAKLARELKNRIKIIKRIMTLLDPHPEGNTDQTEEGKAGNGMENPV